MLNQVEYYRSLAVRKRIGRFVSHTPYIVGYGESELWRGNDKGFYTARLSGLRRMLDRGLDVLTCLQQDNATLGLLDIEYYNPRYPGEAHLNPVRVFRLLEPVYERIMSVYRRFGISPLGVITGQGYHFWTKVPFGPGHRVLEELGKIEPSLAASYARRKISFAAGYGFSGMGRLQLFLAGEIMKELNEARRSGEKILPAYFSDINPPHGREAVSIDLTTYADPIYMRDARVPFSSYQKHKILSDKVGKKNAERIPVEIIVPRIFPSGEDQGLEESLITRRHFRKAADLAARSPSDLLPDSTEGWTRAAEAYRRSPFSSFFYYFDEGPRRLPKFSYKSLPPCIRHALNPWELLEPTQAQSVVRVMDKMGFHPKEIAELFYRQYRRTPFGHYNPQRRAYFWVQSYAALIHAGLDTKKDLTCRDHFNRNRCVKPRCGRDLSSYR